MVKRAMASTCALPSIMRETDHWELRHYGILVAVVAVHLATIAALLAAARVELVAPVRRTPLEVIYLPAVPLPSVRAENAAQHRFQPPLMVSVAPSLPTVPTRATAGPEGHGTGVDWSAEARRALQAYDIRARQPPGSRSVSGAPWEESWQHWGRYAAGERMKTPGGDWIVWISADCYRIAHSGPTRDAPDAALPETVCRKDP